MKFRVTASAVIDSYLPKSAVEQYVEEALRRIADENAVEPMALAIVVREAEDADVDADVLEFNGSGAPIPTKERPVDHQTAIGRLRLPDWMTRRG